MTDLSKYTLAELEAMKCDEAWKHYNAGKAIDAVNAEIERREAEPDYAAWEPKWQAFCDVADWISSKAVEKKTFIRALIAAHNTPLAGEWTEYRPTEDHIGPKGVSLATHEIEFQSTGGEWLHAVPSWSDGLFYRYRPKQTDDWIPWAGGECPVPGKTLVQVELRNGSTRGDQARWYCWEWADKSDDIIAYRVVKEP